MKTIIFYSGKGGVGKTTVSSLAATTLARQGNKVCMLDADINTPSLAAIFPNKNYDNLSVYSTGYDKISATYFSDKFVDGLIRGYVKSIKKEKPDYLIIDTPPSITSIHHSLLKLLNISGVVVVSQKTKLALTDVNKTVSLFSYKSIKILGLVFNMVSPELSTEMDTDLPILGEIRLTRHINDAIEDGKMFEVNESITELVDRMIESESVPWVEYANKIELYPDFTIEDAKGLVAMQDKISINKLSFKNVETWDYLRDKLREMQRYGLGRVDAMLDHTPASKVQEIFDHFSEDRVACVRVLRRPIVGIDIFTGEFGYAELILNSGEDSYYNLPRVRYMTDDGEVIMFPHEISPATEEDIQSFLKDDEVVAYPRSQVQRYIPRFWVMRQIVNQFGAHNAPNGWEDFYKDNNIILEGEMPQYHERKKEHKYL